MHHICVDNDVVQAGNVLLLPTIYQKDQVNDNCCSDHVDAVHVVAWCSSNFTQAWGEILPRNNSQNLNTSSMNHCCLIMQKIHFSRTQSYAGVQVKVAARDPTRWPFWCASKYSSRTDRWAMYALCRRVRVCDDASATGSRKTRARHGVRESVSRQRSALGMTSKTKITFSSKCFQEDTIEHQAKEASLCARYPCIINNV